MLLLLGQLLLLPVVVVVDPVAHDLLPAQNEPLDLLLVLLALLLEFLSLAFLVVCDSLGDRSRRCRSR